MYPDSFLGPPRTSVYWPGRKRECRIRGLSRREQSFPKSAAACHCGNWGWSREHPWLARVTTTFLPLCSCSCSANHLCSWNKPKQLFTWKESTSRLELWLEAFPRPQSDPCHLQNQGGPYMTYWNWKTTKLSLESAQAHIRLNPFQYVVAFLWMSIRFSYPTLT